MIKHLSFLYSGLIFALALSILACTPKKTDVLSETPAEIPEKAENQAAESVVSLNPSDPIPVDSSVRTGILPNGLKYFIQHNAKPEDRVELRLAIKAGSINEDEDQQGLAHFLEHMAFNGTEHFEKSELVDYLESTGVKFGPDLNAYTSFDETVYMLQARTDEEGFLDKGLTVLRDWAGGISLDTDEIDKERGVVLSEWRTGLSADERMLKKWLPVVYKDSRYSKRLPIGKPEIIQNAPPSALKRFYNDWYRPNLMAVSIVGDIDVNEIEKEVKMRFGSLKNPVNPRERKQYKIPMHEETYVSIESDPEAAFTTLILQYKHPHMEMNTMNDYRQSMIHRLYNGMINARLNELTQSGATPLIFAYSGYDSDFGDIDAYSGYARVQAGKSIEALETILVENERVRKHGFTESELERQKIEVLKGMEKAYNESDKTQSNRLVMRYVYHFLEGVPMPGIKNEYAMYQMLLPTIQVRDVNQLAKKWITDENRAVVITGPEVADAPMPTESEVRATLQKVKAMEVEAYSDEVSDAPLMDATLSAVAPQTVSMIEDMGITEVMFPNGVRAVLKPTDFKNDEIVMTAISPGGSSLYSDEDYMSATNSSRTIGASGVGEFSATALDKKLSGTNTNLSTYVGSLREGLNGSTTPEHLETLLQLVYLKFTKPRKDADYFASFTNRSKSVYENLLLNPQYFFINEVLKIGYADNPRMRFPKAEDFDALSLDKSMKHYQERFGNAGDFTFFFVGNFENTEMIELLGKYLGNLPGDASQQENFQDLDINLVNGTIRKTIENGSAPKSMVDMKFHGDFEYTADNIYHFQSMLDVLRIKLRESMREDKGGVYGVRVSGDVDRYPSPNYTITISFNADPPMVQELIETAHAGIKNAKENGAEEKDLNKVKETQRQERIKQLKENKFWLDNMRKSYWEKGKMSDLTLEALEEHIRQLDAKDISMSANQYFDMDNYIEVIMMPKE